MSHTIYTSEAILIKVASSYETGAVVNAYVRDIGLILASARGIRKMQSKLRGHLKEMSLSELSLVRGRGDWRITGARSISTLTEAVSVMSFEIEALARALKLVSRLIQGEQADTALFETVKSMYSFASQNRLSAKEAAGFEILGVLRILRHLGYIGEEKNIKHLYDSSSWNMYLIADSLQNRRVIIPMINASLKESQL